MLKNDTGKVIPGIILKVKSNGREFIFECFFERRTKIVAA